MLLLPAELIGKNLLISQNNKDQVITTETIITQKLNNPYLRWNPADYDGIQKILVDPNEIWVPDIVLENNADDEVVQAGHLEKFRSWVLLKSDGNNTWLSPATFKSTCTLDVQFFPFDKQRCNMVFRSLTSDSSILNIDTKQIESENPEEVSRCADDEVVQAGHLEKFRSWVLLKSDGNNTWLSPATFKSTCTLDVQFFPFDKQRCNMVFRSLTSDSSILDIDTKQIESENPEEDLKLSTSNGYWTLRSIEIKGGEYKRSRDQKFREVDLSFFIGRRPTHFVVFSIVPCMIIGMLVLVSFFIPAESGERIGLCATILLAVSVYLLVVTEQLPEQSETLPLIGVYYIVIMFEIGLALAATVLVLMAHHATSEPPRYLAYITVLNRIGCRKKKTRKSFRLGSPTTLRVGAENAGTTVVQNDNVELGEAGRQSPAADLPKEQRPSTAYSIVQLVNEEDENQEAWKEIARALDRIFFWLFLTLFVVSSIVVYGQAGRLRSLDSFDD
ncbi:neuronal acetylcholine receptor subunit beta-3-like [Orbicella faveolata]|uniref:neuronal acetylcholine receptor subunit beta-3-like n=1 Tax=Orbicella faveolata TaxID=48498 RepID=UPI0009E378A1|nr:neuronal acetylcholine receptor subunit beta-3-like [Orbicella faveolata]